MPYLLAGTWMSLATCSSICKTSGNYELAAHILPRRRLHSAKDDLDCPVPLNKLDPVRVTMKKLPDGQVKIMTDNGQHLHANTKEAWTGVTVYQLNGATRKEFGMYANLPAKKVARQQKSFAKRKPYINERHLSVQEKDLFMKAKVKELQSLFKMEFGSLRRRKKQTQQGP